MIRYILRSIKGNKVKIGTLILLMIISTTMVLFTAEIVYNFIQSTNVNDQVLKEDSESLVNMLQIFIGILIGFSFLIINNTYSIILCGREDEFRLLYNLGYDKNSIKKMISIEVTFIAILCSGVSSILSYIAASIFLDHYNTFEDPTINYTYFAYALIIMIVVMLYVIQRNFDHLKITIDDQNETEVKVLDKKKIRKYTVSMILGLLVAILCALDVLPLEIKYSGEQLSLNAIVFWIGIFVALDGIIYWILRIFALFSERFNIISIYLATKQCLFDYKQINVIMTSMIISVVLLVGMQGVFYSVRETTKNYVNSSLNYDFMIVTNDMFHLKDTDIEHKLNMLGNEESNLSIALTIETIDPKGKKLRITGIDPSYYAMQHFYMCSDEGELDDIYKSNGQIYLLAPSVQAQKNHWNVGSEVSNYELNGMNLTFTVAKIYKPIDILQGFTSREGLSNLLFSNSDMGNTIYLKGYEYQDVVQVLNEIGCKDYNFIDMQEIRNKSMDQVIQGTELIEVLINVVLFLVASLVVNIFIVSFSNRRKYYARLMISGISKKVLIYSMLLESVIIYGIGAILGWVLGIPFVEGGIQILQTQLVFDTVLYIPTVLISTILGFGLIGVIICTFIIGTLNLKGDMLKYNYKE